MKDTLPFELFYSNYGYWSSSSVIVALISTSELVAIENVSALTRSSGGQREKMNVVHNRM